MKTTLLLVLVALFAVPLAQPAPSTCADPCHITATSVGYQLPAALIASGASVVFTSGDTGHVTVDGAPILANKATCFQDTETRGIDSAPITFAIAGGVLSATQNGVTTPCLNAIALANGGFAVPFFCKIHSTMRGVLVVEP